MTLSSPNEPTEGPGLTDVYDIDGLHVGHVRPHDEVDAPSEDLARVILHLDAEVRNRFGLNVDEVDVEATWLENDETGDHLVLNRAIEVALREQGFDL